MHMHYPNILICFTARDEILRMEKMFDELNKYLQQV